MGRRPGAAGAGGHAARPVPAHLAVRRQPALDLAGRGVRRLDAADARPALRRARGRRHPVRAPVPAQAW
nr:hypothetical protein [Angustibacter aerolatus]